MTDINTSNWTTRDADNTAPAPNGIQDSYPANAVTGVIQAVRGAVKREYVTTNPTVTSTGAGGAYALMFDLMPTLDKGKKISFWPNHQNTGAASVNLNGQGSFVIVNEAGDPLAGGEIKNDIPVELIFDGARFRLTGFSTANSVFTGNTRVTNLTASGTITGNISGASITSGVIPNDRLSGNYDKFGAVRMNKLELANGTSLTEIAHLATGTAITNKAAAGGNVVLNMRSTGGIDALTLSAGAVVDKVVLHEGNLTAARVNAGLGYTAANSTINLTAGNGLTGGGTIAAARSFALGTPSAITNATTNSVTATSHSHELSLSSADIIAILGYTPAATVAPVGSVLTMSGDTTQVPTGGYLLADGSPVTSQNPALRAYYLGVTGWPKNASGDPLLPDYRGYFLRGWGGTSQPVDNGRAFASTQTSQNLAHTHTGTAQSAGAHTHGVPQTPGANSGPYRVFQSPTTVTGSFGTVETQQSGTHTHVVDIPSGGGGTEARPVNKAVTFWIKT